MRKLIGLTLLLASMNAFGQSPSLDFKYGIMLSNLSATQHTTTTILGPTNIPVAVQRTMTVDWLQLVPAFTWQMKSGDFGQLSIPQWALQRQQTTRTDSTGAVTQGVNRKVNLGLQYTYAIRFLKQKSTKWLPMLGFGIMPFLAHDHTEPVVDTQFANTTTKGGLVGTLNPHLMYMPTSRLFIDMGLSLNIFDFNVSSYLDELPTIPLKGGYTVNWDMFNGTNGVQLGIGLKL